MSTISETWIDTFFAQRPKARELYRQAQELIAGGVGHDMRYNPLAPTYIAYARGSRKWDIDGNEYVDYGMGNGALLVGHAHPKRSTRPMQLDSRAFQAASCRHSSETSRYAEWTCSPTVVA